MIERVWKPNSTVAAVVERQGRFLLVEEHTADGLRFNQPAGHLEHGESLVAACVRETAEETGYRVVPTGLLGIYQWSPPAQGDLTFLRFAYVAEVAIGGEPPANVQLDEGIARAVWLSLADIEACRDRHRSPLVMRCIEDYLAGRRFPLDVVHHHD
jgi:8-oxo-dGTP pyrophosphatase MutT (NUDIX family)